MPHAEVVLTVRLVQVIFVAFHVGAADGLEVGADAELLEWMVVRVHLEHVLRHLRDLVAGHDGDMAAIGYALFAGECVAVAAVAAGPDDLRALVGGFEEGVFDARVQVVQMRKGRSFNALAAGFAEVLEVAEAGLLRCDEEQIVVVDGVEVASGPAVAAVRIAADAELVGAGDNLLERRIADERVGQRAGKVGIGATKLGGCWGAARFTVIKVGIQQRVGLVDNASGWIEALEDVVGGQTRAARRRLWQTVRVVDVGVVVTATGVEDPLAHAECVGYVEAGCGGDAVQVHAVVVERSIVVELTAVVEGRNAGDGEAVGVQVSPLRVLDEGEACHGQSLHPGSVCCAWCSRRAPRLRHRRADGSLCRCPRPCTSQPAHRCLPR